jgi:hypothetical protein
MPRVQIKRGLKTHVPNSGMLAGEQFFATDRGSLHIATDATTRKTIVPAIDDLDTLASVAEGDFVLMHDISEATPDTQMEKKLTFANFKAALNIPAASTDEKVAIVSGATAGYLWGTDGTDGVLRGSASIAFSRGGTDAFGSLAVDVVDCGTFGA